MGVFEDVAATRGLRISAPACSHPSLRSIWAFASAAPTTQCPRLLPPSHLAISLCFTKYYLYWEVQFQCFLFP